MEDNGILFTPKHLRIFTLKDAWVWVVIWLVAVVAFIGLLFIPTAETVHFLINGGILVAATIITVLHFARRWELKKEWVDADKLSGGVGIDYELLSDRYQNELVYSPDHVVRFWEKVLSLKAAATRSVYAGLYGTMIRVVEHPINVGGIKCMGTQDGYISTVVSPDVIAETTTYKDPTAAFLDVICHELSHRVLMILGYDPGRLGEKHHELFKKHNLPW